MTEYEVASVILLLYHSFGESKVKPINRTSRIFLQLGENGMELYKKIFDNNSNQLVTQFF